MRAGPGRRKLVFISLITGYLILLRNWLANRPAIKAQKGVPTKAIVRLLLLLDLPRSGWMDSVNSSEANDVVRGAKGQKAMTIWRLTILPILYCVVK